MASLEVIIRDDHGNIIETLPPQSLELGQQTLHEIEGAVEQWKQTTLPDIESRLLQQAQTTFNRTKKKG